MELRQCPKGLPLSCNDVRWSKLIKKKKENYNNIVHARTSREIKVLKNKGWIFSQGKQPQPGNMGWIL